MSLLEHFDRIIELYNNYIGGYAVLFLLIPTGLYFIIRLRFLNVTKIRHSILVVAGRYDKKGDKGDVSHFKALTTALSATVGTGNIVGVSLAIYLGGPGAIFWMWVTGFLGMILKYAECTLSHKYRTFNSDGSVSGGPMYYIRDGITEIYNLPIFAKVLAAIFAFSTILCSLGTGNMAQSNSMAAVFHASYNLPEMVNFLGFSLAIKEYHSSNYYYPCPACYRWRNKTNCKCNLKISSGDGRFVFYRCYNSNWGFYKSSSCSSVSNCIKCIHRNCSYWWFYRICVYNDDALGSPPGFIFKRGRTGVGAHSTCCSKN